MYWLREEKKIRVPLVVGLIVLLVCLGASSSWALGTPAGNMISCTAAVNCCPSRNRQIGHFRMGTNYTLSSFPAPLIYLLSDIPVGLS